MIRLRLNADGQKKFEARIKLNGRRLYKTFATESAAQEWIEKLERIRSNGLQIKYESVTISMLFENYIQACKLKRNAPTRACPHKIFSQIKEQAR